jgi:hypothetical protein
VKARLAAAGMLAPPRTLRSYRRALFAASLALLLVGFLLGRLQAPRASSERDMSRYILLLHADASFRLDHSVVVQTAEYARWAHRLGPEVLSGDKLGDRVDQLTAADTTTSVAPPGFVAGFFVLRAASDARALAIARSCPHLAHGGRIELRKIMF